LFAAEEVFSREFVYGKVFPAGEGYVAMSLKPIGRHYASSFYAKSKEAAACKLVAAIEWEIIREAVLGASAKAMIENAAFVAGREEMMGVAA
jgi:hypothetical protein